MRFFTDADIGAVLGWAELIQAIEQIMVESEAAAPARTFHTVPDGNGNDAAFLLKPGWVAGEIIGVKAVTVFPDNGEQGLPMVQAGVLLFDGVTGSLVGACEANTLTARRTAAASAVAAKRLARTDSSRLLVVGTGALAPMAIHSPLVASASLEPKLIPAEGAGITVSNDQEPSPAFLKTSTCSCSSAATRTSPLIATEEPYFEPAPCCELACFECTE